MSMLPKEHGAYGQIAFPILTALAVGGVSVGGLLIGAMMVSGFLAHEPAAVMLGLHGVRAKREAGAKAGRWLAACLTLGVTTGSAALIVMPAVARWSLAVPLVPAVVLALVAAKGREKSGPGEVAATLAFSGAAVPVSLAAGATVETAITVAVPFALLFIAGTLAVRVVILRVRGGGDRRAAQTTRRAAFLVCGGATVTLGALTLGSLLPWAILAAAAPGLLTATVIAACPPPPARLRTLGWALVAASLITAAITVVAAS